MASKFCNYHPLSPATYYCSNCGTCHCDKCVDEGERGADQNCFTCHKAMDSLGASNNAMPFWRRLQESFRYPTNKHAMALIVGVAILTSVLLYLPFGFIFSLMVTGAFMKYCFSSLNNTASGTLTAPDITEAYGGGITLLLQLLAIFIVIGAVFAVLFQFIDPGFASFFLFLSVVALPAVIIIFSMTDSLKEALNPANVTRLITAIGLPYGLLLGFIMIMMASVGIINSIFDNHLSLVSAIFQATVSNYYTLVIFHIMGYMIFQYQGQLGFYAREDSGEERPPRSERDRFAVQIDIRLKEGDYNKVIELYQLAMTKFPKDRDFFKQYFEFILATERRQAVADYATQYLTFLIRSDQEYQLSLVYKRILHILPDYVPETPLVRHQLAKVCKQNGDPLSAAKLINGMHKLFPDYEKLPDALLVLAEALDKLPNKQANAALCRELVKRLKEREPKPKVVAQKKPAPLKPSNSSEPGNSSEPSNPVKPGNNTINFPEASSFKPTGVKKVKPKNPTVAAESKSELQVKNNNQASDSNSNGNVSSLKF